MKPFARLCAMCVRLLITSPLWWVLVALVLVWRWRHPAGGWLWFLAFVLAGAVALGVTVFFEAGGGLYERIHLAGAERVFLASAGVALLVLSLVLFAVSVALG